MTLIADRSDSVIHHFFLALFFFYHTCVLLCSGLFHFVIHTPLHKYMLFSGPRAEMYSKATAAAGVRAAFFSFSKRIDNVI